MKLHTACALKLNMKRNLLRQKIFLLWDVCENTKGPESLRLLRREAHRKRRPGGREDARGAVLLILAPHWRMELRRTLQRHHHYDDVQQTIELAGTRLTRARAPPGARNRSAKLRPTYP